MLDDHSARFFGFVAFITSLFRVESWVASAPLSTCRTLLSSLSFKPVLATWYGLSSIVGGGHPSWPLEVTGNSGFFVGTFWLSLVPSAGGNTLLFICRVEWA